VASALGALGAFGALATVVAAGVAVAAANTGAAENDASAMTALARIELFFMVLSSLIVGKVVLSWNVRDLVTERWGFPYGMGSDG
jgi:hypothetical protein